MNSKHLNGLCYLLKVQGKRQKRKKRKGRKHIMFKSCLLVI